MGKDKIVRVVDEIQSLIQEVTTRLKALGMTEEAIEKFLAGEEVIICHYCNTPNMLEVHYNKDNEWSMYGCLSCSKTYLKDWKKD